MVYNGAFFYNRAFSRDVIRYDLRHRYVAAWTTLHDSLLEEQGHNPQSEVGGRCRPIEATARIPVKAGKKWNVGSTRESLECGKEKESRERVGGDKIAERRLCSVDFTSGQELRLACDSLFSGEICERKEHSQSVYADDGVFSARPPAR